MSAILVASREPGTGRTAVSAGLAGFLVGQGTTVRVARLRPADGADPGAEDDARTLSAVSGASGARSAISEQDALALVRDAAAGVAVIEAPAGTASDLATRLSARVVFVTNDGSDVAHAKSALGAALAGVVATRVPERRAVPIRTEIESKGATCLAVILEDRLLAGPNVQEMTQALHASALVERGPEEEAVEYVMLGPISADPGQPYFLQHGSKAVVNRFDKMDLHLAALATEPDCLILTGGQMPSPYLLDRVAGSDFDVTVLLAPDSTVRTVEVLDELFGSTRFTGKRKLNRAIDLMSKHLDSGKLAAAL